MTVTARVGEALARWLAVRGTDAPAAARMGEALRASGASCGPIGLRHSAASTVAKLGSLSELLALGQW